MEKKQEELLRKVEEVLGMELKTPSDFEQLGDQIYRKTGEQLSLSTLKRCWGYVGKGNKMRVTTLDILARYAGYQGWVAFCQADFTVNDESGYMLNRHLYLVEQPIGTHIELRWKPDRVVTMRYEGQDLLTVVESIGSKLRPGDTCHCTNIVEGFPLMLFSLVRDGKLMGNYVCGKKYGVQFSAK